MSTTVKAYEKIGGTTRTGLYLARGLSKDHRPDLIQLVYSLTISSDGAVPIHYKTYPGNRTDDTTHIETWTTLRRIVGRPNFLYVADCKVCTDEQLPYIVRNGGRVVMLCLIPGKKAHCSKTGFDDTRNPNGLFLGVRLRGNEFYRDELNPIHIKVLELLGLKENDYRPTD